MQLTKITFTESLCVCVDRKSFGFVLLILCTQSFAISHTNLKIIFFFFTFLNSQRSVICKIVSWVWMVGTFELKMVKRVEIILVGWLLVLIVSLKADNVADESFSFLSIQIVNSEISEKPEAKPVAGNSGSGVSVPVHHATVDPSKIKSSETANQCVF